MCKEPTPGYVANATYNVQIAMIRNIIQDRCLPRENIPESMLLNKKTAEIIIRTIVLTEIDVENDSSIPAYPHHAIVVRCQANRNVRLVNQSLPNNCGKSERYNNRFKMNFSPSTE